MKKINSKKITHIILIGSLFFFTVKPFWFKPKEVELIETKLYDFKQESLFIENKAGSVNIESWDKNNIEIIATKKADKNKIQNIKIDYNLSDNKLLIKTSGLENNSSVKLDIKAPKQISLVDINVNAGSTQIKDINAKINIKTNAGSVNIENAVSSVDIKVDAGSVNITQRELSSKDNINIDTQTGSIVIALPKDINALITASAHVGSITSGFKNLKIKREFPFISASAKGRINKGDSKINLVARTGSISIK